MESGAFYDGIDGATVASQRKTWTKLAEFLNCSKITPPVTDSECIVSAPMAALNLANQRCCGGWSITVDGKDLVAPGMHLCTYLNIWLARIFIDTLYL